MKKEGNLWKISMKFYEGEYPYAFVPDGYKRSLLIVRERFTLCKG
jgi:hypothetical protein